MMKIAVIGATGLVGNVMLQVLEERGFDATGILTAASSASKGNKLTVNQSKYTIHTVEDVIGQQPDVAIFSAGSKASAEYAPLFARQGTFVIDNSSQWRMFDHVPLVVPEINADTITGETKIIANPNCSTIQLVMVLYPLHLCFGIRRVVVSTYQSVTGTGVKAVRQLEAECEGKTAEKAYPHPINRNLFPHGGTFQENGYTSEEIKLVNETRKILNAPQIRLTATVVRVPVTGGHSEAVNVEFERDFTLDKVRQLLSGMSGVEVLDDPHANLYPMPLYARNRDEVFVGRIRRDFSRERCLNMWISADNLRKGAATNAVQIAQYLRQSGRLQNGKKH
jgi:aspartate-semialdehyde dehydrogenase